MLKNAIYRSAGVLLIGLQSSPLLLAQSWTTPAKDRPATDLQPPVRILADGQEVCDEPVVLGAVANGRYFGGGMLIAPNASPADGLLDLVIVRELSKATLLASLPSLYRGTHLANPAVSVVRASRIEAHPSSPEAPPVWIDVDGEGLGTLPLEIEVLPQRVTLFGAEELPRL